jgi:hypothetical protein
MSKKSVILCAASKSDLFFIFQLKDQLLSSWMTFLSEKGKQLFHNNSITRKEKK